MKESEKIEVSSQKGFTHNYLSLPASSAFSALSSYSIINNYASHPSP